MTTRATPDDEVIIVGAWHFNTYPGEAVDIPSLSYSSSFERNTEW